MGVIKEFNDLHISLKTAAIGIAIVMPFWYLDIFILAPKLINSNQNIQIPIILSFCLSVMWLFVNYVVSVKMFRKDSKTDEGAEMAFAVLLSTISISLCSIFGYLVKFKLFYFVIFSFVCYPILAYITVYEKDAKDHKKTVSKK